MQDNAETGARYQIPWYNDATIGGSADQWTLQDYTLCHALDLDDNYQAEDAVQDHLLAHDPALAGRARFDSEMGCFFAHTDSEADAQALATHIANLVAAGPYPNAIPGDMGASPAFIRAGELHVPDSWDQ